MGKTELKQDERIQWLRFVLNPSLPMLSVHNWQRLLRFAERQSIVGVCDPSRFDDLRPDKKVLLEWIGRVALIRGRNEVLNRQAVVLTQLLAEAGFRCCILKGQGNAAMYPDPGLRAAGDIDVWVDADEKSVLEYVKQRFPEEKESYKHIKFPLFQDTEVDMHHTPLRFYHPAHNRRLQRWIAEQKEQQMVHYIRLAGTDADVAIPTVAFNAVYQMGHILIHVEDEGIGLRQMVDYYYVLQSLASASVGVKDAVMQTWERLGLTRLARAVMWVERELLGLEPQYLLVEPDEKKGRLLAEDILEGGNFGHHSSRQRYRAYGRYVKKSADAWRLVRLSACFPGEAMYRLLGKTKTAGKILLKKK